MYRVCQKKTPQLNAKCNEMNFFYKCRMNEIS